MSTSSLLGVDITSATVKLLELTHQGGHFRIDSWSVQPLAEGAVIERRIRDMESVVRALGRAMEQAKPRTRRAAVAIPTSAAITKVLSLPRDMSDEDIENRIALESDKHIPFPFNEVAFDFHRLGVSARHDDQENVLLVACRRSDTQLLTDALEQVGLKPMAVDVESFAMERACRQLMLQLSSDDSNCCAVVDIGATMTAFHIVHDGRIVHSRDSVIGGRQLTDEIRQQYSLTFEEAGLAKKRGDLPDYEAKLLKPFRDGLVQQIMRLLRLYYTTAGAREIDRIVLGGGSSLLPGLREQLAFESRLEVVGANPFDGMPLNRSMDRVALTRDAPAMLTAYGLAMRVAL
ncbi:type IV pilus assembly protein PilM [Kushneria phosphatilytica]|uniref:Type IV pilus assembly protein PilM n=1 Tax=Kushneria phosphatilytica TaxID=657387 RepID=A0A1S1NQ54_9GAMM|nr:type IV pilus assembly protein PilM [Kushneria phosphatilytica]OHV10509.1 pilus assembly protein PilM [Kushneria phosphatilytica]QEL11932.1 type IV pilus assembly protein PilM [Kushneria phosphatilytica]